MATLKTKKLLAVTSEWKDASETYKGKVQNWREAQCKVQDDHGESEMIVRVSNDRIAKALVPGTSYVGVTFKPDGYALWCWRLTASDNPSLQKESQYGSSGPGHAGSLGAGMGSGTRENEQGCGSASLVVACITNATLIVISEQKARVGEGVVDIKRLNEIAADLMDTCRYISQPPSAAHVKEPSKPATPSAGMNDTMKAKLQETINASIKKAGLWDAYDLSQLTVDDVIDLWTDCKSNEVQFAIKLNEELKKAAGVPADDAGAKDEPDF